MWRLSCGVWSGLRATPALAAGDFLPPEQAFRLTVSRDGAAGAPALGDQRRLLSVSQAAEGRRQAGGQRSGNRIFCEWYSVPLVDDLGRSVGILSLSQDITERRQTRKQLDYLAYYRCIVDPLTDLPNRTLLEDRVSRNLIEAQRHGMLVAAVFLGIDGFKIVNGTMGQDAGDQNDASTVKAIIAMARSLRLKVIAEGVELRGQLEYLTVEGGHEVQGYYFGKPRTARIFPISRPRGGSRFPAHISPRFINAATFPNIMRAG